MSVLAPPPQDDLELLIREARARQRQRQSTAAAVVAVAAALALAISSAIAGGGRRAVASAGSASVPTTASSACRLRVLGKRILRGGRVVYREPVPRTFGHQIACSGDTVWVVFYNGVASSQQAYLGVRSGDSGRTWRLVFAEPYFGVRAPHQLDSYMGAWRLDGPRAAYFTGRCPACGPGTVSLWVTKDGGRTFRRYRVPGLRGYGTTAIRVSGGSVAISGTRWVPAAGPPRKTVRLKVP